MFGAGSVAYVLVVGPVACFLIPAAFCLVSAVFVQLRVSDLSPRKILRRDVLIKDMLPWRGLSVLPEQSKNCVLLLAQICLGLIAAGVGGAMWTNFMLWRYGWTLEQIGSWYMINVFFYAVSALALGCCCRLGTIYRWVLYPSTWIFLVL